MLTVTSTASAILGGRFISADWLVESSALDVHWSHAFSGPPHSWEQRLRSISEIELGVREHAGGIAAVNSVEVRVVEDGTGQSPRTILNTLKKFEGADLSIALLLQNEVYSDRIQLFTGRVERVTWEQSIAVVTAVDDSLHENVQLPQTLIDNTRFPNAPAQSLNRPIGLVYGRCVPTRIDIVPMLLIDETNFVDYIIADHPAQLLLKTYGLWPGGLNGARVIRAASNAVPSFAGASTTTMTLSNPITNTLFKGLGLSTSFVVQRAAGVVLPTNAIDGVSDSIATINTDSFTNDDGDGFGELGIATTFSMPEGANTMVLNLANHRRVSGSPATLTGQLRVRLVDDAGAIQVDDFFVTESFRHTSNPRSEEYTIKPVQLDGMTRLEAMLRATHEGGPGSALAGYEVGELSFQLGYLPDSPLEQVYLDGSEKFVLGGRPDDSSGTITGTPDKLIENSADVVRSLLVQELGLSVNASSFDEARTTLSATSSLVDGGLGVGWYLERTPAREALHDVSRMARCYLLPGGDGAFRFNPYERLGSAVFSCTQDHVLLQEGALRSRSPRSTLSVTLSDFAEIANSFRVFYQYHPGRGKFDKIFFANENESNHSDSQIAELLRLLCAQSVVRYGTLPVYEIEAYWLYNEKTAEELLTHIVEYFVFQQPLVSFDMNLNALRFELGDFIEMDKVSLLELPQDDNERRYELVRKRIVPTTGRVHGIFRRVHTVDTDYFQMLDQVSATWYWWVTASDTVGFSSAVPVFSGFAAQANDLNLSPTPYWLDFTAFVNFSAFVYPNVSGAPTFTSDISGFVGVGMSGSPTVTSENFIFERRLSVDPDCNVVVIDDQEYVEFFIINDQGGVPWYFWFDGDGQVVRHSAFPIVTSAPRGLRNVTPSAGTPDYLSVSDEAGTKQFLYPASDTGELLIAASAPSGTAEDVASGKQAFSEDAGVKYELGVFSWGTYRITRVSS